MPSPTPQSERRRAPRAHADFQVRLSHGKPDGRTAAGPAPAGADARPAMLRDISEIGLACHAPSAIPEMTLVGLDFSLPGASDVHHVRGAVVRCEPLRGEPRRFDVAVYFTEMTPVTRAALRNYVGKARKV